MAKIIIIDGNSLLFRAFYATSFKDGPLLSTSYGTPTNAIVAFSNMLCNIMKTINKDDGIFVAFDKGKHTFRHEQFKDYKANRKPTPHELLVQMPIARELLKCLNIPFYEADEIEADDIAGIMAKKANKENYNVEIYTSDHDYLQLINELTTIKLIKKGLSDIKDMTLDSFQEEYGIKPIQITDFKGLLGDPSDNLPGIPKVGEKTALSLIKEYGDIDNIILGVKNLKTKVAQNILEYQDVGKLSKKLATIKIDEEISFNVNDTIYNGYTLSDVNEFATKYEMKKLINRLPTSLRIQETSYNKVDYFEINNTEDLNLSKGFGVALDIENVNYHDAQIYGIAICLDDKVYYLPYEALKNNTKFIKQLEDKSIRKYCFDFKTIRCVLYNHKIKIDGLYFDLMLSNYLLDSSIKPDFISVMNFNQIDISYAIEEEPLLVVGNKKLSSCIAYFSYNLYEKMIFKLKEKDQLELLKNIEQPLSIVLSDIENEGFPVNSSILFNFKKEYEEKLACLEKDIYALAGEKFNISSPKQLGVILYEKLKLKSNKRNSTSVEFLKNLTDIHPIVPLILEYRKYSKLISQYIDGIISFIKKDGKIHATFNQAITTTGRLSSSEPNLQNISIRDEEGKQIRKAFTYQENDIYILSLDYSQIELRILAHLANSKTLIDIFNNNEDIHSETAKKVFRLNSTPSSEERRKAKAVNFGIVYGISDWGLAEQINSSVTEAKEIIKNFYDEFPEIKDYLNSLVDFAKTHGYATTMFNRRRYLEELNDPSYQIREFAKRAAMNAPIQGSAADLIKIAMIQISNELKEKKFKSCMISQIHDELIFKLYDSEKEEVIKIVKNIMENCVKLNVNLKVDGGYAKTWFDAK